MLKVEKQGGAVVAVIKGVGFKNRVVDISESKNLSVLCVQRLVPGSIGKKIA